MAACQCELRPGLTLSAIRAIGTTGTINVFQRGAIGHAQFPRDIQTQPGAARRRCNEGLEQPATDRRRDTRAIVDHLQFYNTARLRRVRDNTNAAGTATAVAPRVAA